MIYPGEHDRIVDTETWNRVRDLLRKNGRNGGKEVRNKYGALLRGLLYCAPCGTAMMHTYTNKNGKRYRYYVCLNAQQRGWAACPTKSLNAHEIETFVVEHIRGIGSNKEIIAETVRRLRARSEKRLEELYRERRAVERVLKRLHARLRKLVGESWKSISSSQLTTDQLADLHDQIRNNEQRMTTIQEEVIALQRETVDEEDVTRALSAFDPVWESLNVREQSRIIHLLIERIGYDGGDGKVTVTFRSLGIKELCARVQPSEEEVL